MTVVLNKPYFCTVWESELSGDDPMNIAMNVGAHFKVANEKGCDAIRITCKIDQLKEPAILTVANNYSRLFSDELTKNGVINVETSKGKKQKYQIKIASNDTTSAYPLAAFVLLVFNLTKVIQHSKVQIVQNATDTTPKKKIELTALYEGGDPMNGIDTIELKE